MTREFTEKDILKWTEVILDPDGELVHDISLNWTSYKKILIDNIAEYLYEDMWRARGLITAPFTFNKIFRRLPRDEKAVWFDYAAEIPEKLKSLNLFIRQFKYFCATCIITDSEIESLASIDHENFYRDPDQGESEVGKAGNLQGKEDSVHVSFQNIPGARKWFFKELNYLIPPQLKKIGFEIVRPEEVAEIDMTMIQKLARAIHSGYLHKMRTMEAGDEKDPDAAVLYYPGDSEMKHLTDFDDLPDDIIFSNTDNAYHIPTKLLSIGYKIRQAKKGFKPYTLHLDAEEVETMARVEHIRWSWDKRLNGWIYGNIKDNEIKTHPGLIPYEELPESEKEKDRELVRLIPALLHDINYVIYPVNPERIKKLSYALKPSSSIHKLLNETRALNEEISVLALSSPDIEEKVKIINNKIEATIREVQGSYTYAEHIQQAFLPGDLYVRECFPDSFVLFKSKDIVSGDFYFFNKRNHTIIFAAADCTGHGIPGALLSTIGYGIIDQAVSEIKLTDPADILNHLYSRLHRFLRRNEGETGILDDMDIALCNLNIQTNLLTFAGVSNPLYRITNRELVEYKAGNSMENCDEKGDYKFVSEEIQLKAGDTIYLFSDGYADQFGGTHHKKYQSTRFKSFLVRIQEYSMSEQSDKLYEEIEQWRDENNEEQTDDILVIGIRV